MKSLPKVEGKCFSGRVGKVKDVPEGWEEGQMKVRKKSEFRRIGMERGSCEEKSANSRNREWAGKKKGAISGNWK